MSEERMKNYTTSDGREAAIKFHAKASSLEAGKDIHGEMAIARNQLENPRKRQRSQKGS